MHSELQHLSRTIRSFSERHQFILNEPCDGVFQIAQRSKLTERMNIAVVCLTHGNEIGGFYSILQFLDTCSPGQLEGKDLTILCANPQAAIAGKRFIDTDLNRSFGVQKPKSQEEHRATQLYPILEKVDLVIDLHQTLGETLTPFYVIYLNQQNLRLSYHCNPELPAVGYRGRQFSADGQGLTTWTTLRGIPAVVVELGKTGRNSTQEKLGASIIFKALTFDPEKHKQQTENIYEMVDGIEAQTDATVLIPDLASFQEVRAGETLAENPEYKAKEDCLLFLPRYSRPLNKDRVILRFLKPIEADSVEK